MTISFSMASGRAVGAPAPILVCAPEQWSLCVEWGTPNFLTVDLTLLSSFTSLTASRRVFLCTAKPFSCYMF